MSAPLARIAKPARYLAALALIVSAVSANAQEWGATATISSTMGINDGRICTGESSRGDIGCATTAPYVSRTSGFLGIGTTNPQDTLHVGNTTSGGRIYIGEDDTNRRGLLLAAATVRELASSNVPHVRIHGFDYGANRSLSLYLNPFGDNALVRVGSNGAAIGEPSATLHVLGSIRMGADSSTTLNTCDTNRTGAIKFQTGDFYVCRNGSSWETLAAAAGGGAASDRIISGTAAVTTYDNGMVNVSSTQLYIGYGTGTGVHPAIEIGGGATANRAAYLDFTGDTTYSDYGLRIIRNISGPNAISDIIHRGTGALTIRTSESAPIIFYTTGAESMRILPSGNVGIGLTAPGYPLEVSGTARINHGPLMISQTGTGMSLASNNLFGSIEAYNSATPTTKKPIIINRWGGYVGIGGTDSPTEKLEVVGNIKATAFIGDGSALTGLATGPSDRIISGTASVNTHSATDKATIVTNSTERLVVTTAGNIGIGQQPNSTYMLDVSGTVRGYNNALSGANTGVIGQSSGASGVLYGVYGRADSTNGRGMYGYASSATGATFGVQGRTDSTQGRGVFGEATTATGVTYGVYGTTNSTDGSGVYGEGSANNGSATGVMGITASTGGYGIYGFASASSGSTYGVYGRATSTSGYGVYSNGNAYVSGSLAVTGNLSYSGTLTDLSDRRFKTNIAPLPFASATQKLSQLAAVQFEMKSAPGVTEYGFIAQDVEKVFPTLVVTRPDAEQTKALNYIGIIPVLVKANQELAAENATLKATQADILKRLEALEKRN